MGRRAAGGPGFISFKTPEPYKLRKAIRRRIHSSIDSETERTPVGQQRHTKHTAYDQGVNFYETFSATRTEQQGSTYTTLNRPSVGAGDANYYVEIIPEPAAAPD